MCAETPSSSHLNQYYVGVRFLQHGDITIARGVTRNGPSYTAVAPDVRKTRLYFSF